MSVLLNVLYKYVVNSFDIQLLAGHDGMDKPVKWVHMVENEEISTFLDGEEVVFTTGIGIYENKDFDLLKLVKENLRNGASGMVVNIGPYIPNISDEILEYCNAMAFPLFIVPWEVKMARIIKVFCMYILEAEKYEMEISKALEKALLAPMREDLYIPIFEEYDFKPENELRFTMFSCKIHPEMNNKIIKELTNKIEFFSYQLDGKIAIVNIEDTFILCSIQLNHSELELLKEKVNSFFTIKASESQLQFMALGKEVKKLNELHKHFIRAKQVHKINSNGLIFKPIEDEQSLGVYELLLSYVEKDGGEKYFQTMLGPLLQYDNANDTDLSVVLKLYLETNGRVNEVAQRMFVHRNTINYKIKKIESLLVCDLSDFFVRLNLSVAFMMKAVL